MQRHTDDPQVYIRSMATRGQQGGLARATRQAAQVLEAAGYGVILIETVGVGQNELDVMHAVHTVIAVVAPGLGDDIQAIKAGVLEIADIHVVSKCDRPDADKTMRDLKTMLAMGLATAGPSAWPVPVLATSAQDGRGIDELLAAIDAHRQALAVSGEIDGRRRRIAERRMLRAADEIVRANFERHRDGRIGKLVDRMMARELTPNEAARALIDAVEQDI
jgi:LAO/AO transport system kinase